MRGSRASLWMSCLSSSVSLYAANRSSVFATWFASTSVLKTGKPLRALSVGS